jgi:hypothetical protein
MRQFLWGVAFGAMVIYFYANYGDNLQQFRRYTLDWRNWAVGRTGYYAAGHEKQ